MRFWFGRKAAPTDARPFVPAWLPTREGEGFARAVEGVNVLVKSTGTVATYWNAAWEVGVVRCSRIAISGNQVVGERQEAISEPTGGAQVDAEARATIGAMLAAMRAHGLIAN